METKEIEAVENFIDKAEHLVFALTEMDDPKSKGIGEALKNQIDKMSGKLADLSMLEYYKLADEVVGEEKDCPYDSHAYQLLRLGAIAWYMLSNDYMDTHPVTDKEKEVLVNKLTEVFEQLGYPLV